MKISFAKNGNWREKMHRAFILRFNAKADFIQEEDAVADPLDERFNGSYAYLTTLTCEQFENGAELGLRCSFEGTGAPILIQVDGKGSSVYIPDMPEKFWVGAALCEGANRLYDLEINESKAFENFLTWGAYTAPIQKFER